MEITFDIFKNDIKNIINNMDKEASDKNNKTSDVHYDFIEIINCNEFIVNKRTFSSKKANNKAIKYSDRFPKLNSLSIIYRENNIDLLVNYTFSSSNIFSFWIINSTDVGSKNDYIYYVEVKYDSSIKIVNFIEYKIVDKKENILYIDNKRTIIKSGEETKDREYIEIYDIFKDPIENYSIESKEETESVIENTNNTK